MLQFYNCYHKLNSDKSDDLTSDISLDLTVINRFYDYFIALLLFNVFSKFKV